MLPNQQQLHSNRSISRTNTHSCSLPIFFFSLLPPSESLLAYIHVERAEFKATVLFQTITGKQEIGQLLHVGMWVFLFVCFKKRLSESMSYIQQPDSGSYFSAYQHGPLIQ